jgi:FkbM family methyltransferase
MVNSKRFKHALKKLTPEWVIRFISCFELLRRITGIGFYGLHKLDRKISPYLPKRDGYFVELGANNGITQSNTFHFEKYKGFTGVLIEPVEAKFLECKMNRSSKNFFANNACVSFEYSFPTVELLYSNLMTTTLGGYSDLTDRLSHAKSGEHLIKDKTYKFEIAARTLNSILIEAGAPHQIDFLSLDVEGSELEVLKGIDFQRFVFSVICIESRDLVRISEFLTGKDYKLEKKVSIHDYLFVYTGDLAA